MKEELTNEMLPFVKDYFQANYYEVISINLESVEQKDKLLLYQFRSLQELGKFVEANIFLKEKLIFVKDELIYKQLSLWKCFNEIFIQSFESFEIGLKEFEAVFAEFQQNDSQLLALYYGLKARLLELGISLGFLSSLQKSEAIELHNLSYALYIKTNNFEEALLTKYRIVELHLKGPTSNKLESNILLLQVITESEKNQLSYLLIKAKLRIAQLEFEEAANTETLDFNKVDNTYNAILEIAQTHKLDKAAANVFYELGTLLLEYGYANGLNLLNEAIARYKILKDYTQIQQSWRNIARWHLQRGEEAENIKAEAEVNQLNEHISIQLSEQIEDLYKIFVAQKQGDAAYIYGFDDESEHSNNSWIENQRLTLKANTYISVGRQAEGIALMKEIISKYKSVGVTPFISEALFNLSNNIANYDYKEAILLINEAIKIDEILEDNHALSQRYFQLASHLFFSNKPNLHFSSDIENHFNKAEQYAKSSKKVDFKLQLGNIYQSKGQLYGIINDYENAGKYLTQAEKIFDNYHLTPQLAFTLSQQGLVLLKVAREFKNPQTFEDAYERFSESANLFKSNSLNTSLWRTTFHQALCKYELAQNLPSNSAEFYQNLEQAELHFKEAALLVDELRFVADNKTGIQRQLAVSDFGEDKQELYLQAFYANFWLKKDYINAITWLERMKSQSFLLETSVEKIKIKRTKTYDDYKLLLQKYQAEEKASKKLLLKSKMEQLLSNLFNYSNIEKKTGYIEPIANFNLIKDLVKKAEEANGQQILIVQYFSVPTLTVAFGIRSDWEQHKIYRIQLNYETLKNTVKSFFHKTEGVRNAESSTSENRFLEEFKEKKVWNINFEQNWQQFNSLITPINEWADTDDIVCLIPHGILHDLPLHTLKIKPNQYLIERNPIFYSPSLSILQQSLQKKQIRNKRDKKAVFGNPTHDLPFAMTEAQYIAEKINAQLFLNEAASKDKFLKLYPKSTLLHFAGHGKAQTANGLEQYILLADKQKLTAKEIFELKTSADLVILSGCETGVNEYQTGDELFGMVRSILNSGAKSLLVSLWAVNDNTTSKLFTSFYDQYTTQNKAKALQMAMKTMINEGYGFYHWGAFVLIGEA